MRAFCAIPGKCSLRPSGQQKARDARRVVRRANCALATWPRWSLPRSQPLWAVLPLDHPLLGGRKTHKILFPLCTLAGESFVLIAVPKKPVMHQWLLAQCAAAGFVPRVVQYAESAESLLDLVATSVGVTLAVLTRARLGREDVRFCPLAEPAPRFTQFVAFRRGARERSPLLAALVTELLARPPAGGRAAGGKKAKLASQGTVPPAALCVWEPAGNSQRWSAVDNGSAQRHDQGCTRTRLNARLPPRDAVLHAVDCTSRPAGTRVDAEKHPKPFQEVSD